MDTQILPRSLTPHQLHARLQQEDILLVDVREPDEHRAWRIPGSVNIPLGDLLRGAPLPPAKDVVVYCATGPRSEVAQRHLRERGIAAPFLEGGMTLWNGVYDVATLRSAGGAEVVQLQRAGKGCLSYVVVKDGEAAVVDPTIDIQEYVAAAEARGARIVAVFDTHAHADHASGARALADLTGATYYAPDEVGAVPHEPLADALAIPVGTGSIAALATPGHTPGSTMLLFDGLAFAGDTIFVDSVGRPDLGQDPATTGPILWRTLRERVLALPPDTRILPGHQGDGSERTPGPVVARLGDLPSRIPALAWGENTFVAWVQHNAIPKPANFETIKRLNQGLARMPDIDDVRDLEAGPNGCAVSG